VHVFYRIFGLSPDDRSTGAYIIMLIIERQIQSSAAAWAQLWHKSDYADSKLLVMIAAHVMSW
jgi:hypothetical protein